MFRGDFFKNRCLAMAYIHRVDQKVSGATFPVVALDICLLNTFLRCQESMRSVSVTQKNERRFWIEHFLLRTSKRSDGTKYLVSFRKSMWESDSLNYSDMYDLLNDIQEIDDYRSGDNRDFVVQVPVYARIAELKPAKVRVQMHHAIDNLMVNLILKRDEGYQYKRIDDQQVRVEKCKLVNEEPFCYIESDFSFKKVIKPHDFFDGSLFKPEIPVLILDRDRAIVLLQNTVEPLTKVLFKPYKFEDFRKHLFEPEQFRKPQNKFQDAVAVLLSLIGFPTIVLGEKRFRKVGEKEKEENIDVVILESGYNVGIDIIAYRENESLLLIDCTIDFPDERKMSNLTKLASFFSSVKDEKGFPKISSLIFSPKD